jgi:hypothetical protein
MKKVIPTLKKAKVKFQIVMRANGPARAGLLKKDVKFSRPM